MSRLLVRISIVKEAGKELVPLYENNADYLLNQLDIPSFRYEGAEVLRIEFLRETKGTEFIDCIAGDF